MPPSSHGLGRSGHASGPDLMKCGFERGKNGCLAWPGLSEAGLSGENKIDPPKAGTRFLSPLGISFSFPGGKWIHISNQCPMDIPWSKLPQAKASYGVNPPSTITREIALG